MDYIFSPALRLTPYLTSVSLGLWNTHGLAPEAPIQPIQLDSCWDSLRKKIRGAWPFEVKAQCGAGGRDE